MLPPQRRRRIMGILRKAQTPMSPPQIVEASKGELELSETLEDLGQMDRKGRVRWVRAAHPGYVAIERPPRARKR